MNEAISKEAIYKEALERIANPVKHMCLDAEAKGYKVDGIALTSIAKDPEYLMQIAKAALES